MRALLFVVLLAGCVTSKPIYTQDGRQGHAIECGGTVRTWGQCLQKAGELCGPRGFDVLDQSGHNSHFTNTIGGNNQVIPTAARSMIVACK